MSMVVRTNTQAISANNALNKNNSTVAGNLQKLSTGFRINRAADDASGLAVSEKMKAQIKALDQASKNAQDGASLIKTAEGYMGEVHDMLNRIVELAEKSANGTYEVAEGETAATEKYGSAGTDRQAIQDEVNQLTAEIDRIAKTANFNGLKLMNGDLATSATEDTPEVPETDDDDTPEVTTTYYTKDFQAIGDEGANVEAGATVYNEAGQSFSVVASDAGEGQILAATVNAAKGQYSTSDPFSEVTTPTDGQNYYTSTDGGVTKSATATKYTAPTEDPEDPEETTDDNGNTQAASGGLTLQIGETSTAADKLTVSIMDFSTDKLFSTISGADGFKNADQNTFTVTQGRANDANANGLTIDVSNQENASAAAEAVRKVINKVSSQRAELGAMENRLDYTMNNLNTASENISDANSRIRDTDMAKTMMEYTQGNTLTQAAQAMLAQANQAPSQVLQLLQ